MSKTTIQWTDESWNPVTGCTRVSEGCRNCYAFSLHDMRHEAYKNGKRVPEQYAKPFTEIQLMPDRLLTPLKRKKPTKWFVNSMSDLFHNDVPDEFIDKVFAAMALADRHIFQVLTKRPERAAEYLNGHAYGRWCEIAGSMECNRSTRNNGYPLSNVWIGTSVEDQKSADLRIPELLKCPAAVRFLSCEPLLGPLDLGRWTEEGLECGYCGWGGHEDDCKRSDETGADASEDWYFHCPKCNEPTMHTPLDELLGSGIHWVIIGGESGKGARECHLNWIRSIVNQCQDAGVACFVKQLGAKPIENDRWDCYATAPEQVVEGLKIRIEDRVVMTMGGGEDCDYPLCLKDSHGGDIDEWPDDLKVREFPK